MGIDLTTDEMAEEVARQAALGIRIVCMTNQHPDFYRHLGPFLSRRAIVRELGGPLWDDDGMLWFIALTDVGAVCGFGAIREEAGGVVWLDNSYVLPDWREKGIYRLLLAARIRGCPAEARIRAICTKASRDALVRRGFVLRRQRGRWQELELLKNGGVA